MTLIEALQTIRDHRRGAGRRYPLWVFLLLVILGTMSGYRGYPLTVTLHGAPPRIPGTAVRVAPRQITQLLNHSPSPDGDRL